MSVSEGFRLFFREAPDLAAAWMDVNRVLNRSTALDPKTSELAYLAVLAALGLQHGVAFHAAEAKRRGATREEVASAVLVGLPAAGHRVVESLPVALLPFDAPATR